MKEPLFILSPPRSFSWSINDRAASGIACFSRTTDFQRTDPWDMMERKKKI